MTADASGVVRAQGLLAAAATDCGRLRDHNEDTYHLDPARGIFLVVDGVGGHAAGDVAAGIAADRIRRRVERTDAPAHVRVREAITLANREILLQAQSDPRLAGMACVLTLAVLEDGDLTIGHVGDSRLYRLDARGITKLTHDHSPIGELEDARAISETDAMLDDRRNEVYRDVGSQPRDPDADDFIELIQTRLSDDAAILLCSDGLTDMLPSLEVNRIVRAHAGAPDAAVAALIEAANALGGKDNITVLIVEGPRFRRAPDGGRAYPPPAAGEDGRGLAGVSPAASDGQVPTLPLADPPGRTHATLPSPASSAATVAPVLAAAPAGASPGVAAGLLHLLHATVRSRGVALVGGVVLGLLVPVGLANAPDGIATRTAQRLLLVGGTTPASFSSIGAAIRTAAAGDVIQVEPGEYPEAIDLPPGVELRAARPGTVMLVAPAGAQDWTAVHAAGAGSVVRGVRISGRPASPIARGIAVDGAGVTVDDVTLDGVIGIGVEVTGADTLVRSSRFDHVTGTAVRLAHDGARLRQNVFRAAATGTAPAVQAVAGAFAALDDNLFLHFPHVVDPATRDDDLIGRRNVVIPAGPRR